MSLKKIDFLKLYFQLRPQGFYFERKEKYLDSFPFIKEALGIDFFFKKESFVVFLLLLKTKTANEKSFCKRVYNIIL